MALLVVFGACSDGLVTNPMDAATAADASADGVAPPADSTTPGNDAGEDAAIDPPGGDAADAATADSGDSGEAGDGKFSIGGTVSGLLGAGLVLQNNMGDDLTVAASGAFTFGTRVPTGTAYSVKISKQPLNPSQVCVVASLFNDPQSSGSGTVGMTNVTSVSITCVTRSYTIGGTVSGLVGTGLKLQNNAGDNLTLNANGGFTFATPLLSGTTFSATILNQPTGPAQTCSVTGASGTVGSANVTSIVVNCSTQTYTVGGTISGLSGTVVLQNKAGNDLTLTANGTFAFSTPLLNGSTYAVTVKTQPTGPSQTCTVFAASGTIASNNVTGVAVVCATNSYTVGGTVSGLSPLNGQLVLQNNNTNNLTVTANGSFTFAAPLLSGATYSVNVLVQPSSPTQVCTVQGGTGTVSASNVTSVSVTCTSTPFTVGGTVSGLLGTGLVVQNNAGDDLPVTANGPFTFAIPIASGASFNVSILTQPTGPAQTCVVSGGTGVVGSGNVTGVVVNCATTTHTVGGTISGLTGAVVLQNNGTQNLTVTSDGTFAFATPFASGTAYSVAVVIQPSNPTQSCTVASGSGTVTSSDVTSVVVTCTTTPFTIGGTLTGLVPSRTVVLRNGTENLTVTGDGSGNATFTFVNPVASGASYGVTVQTAPTNPTQTCEIADGSGVVQNANVTSVSVACTTSTFTVGGTVTGLAGLGLVLQNSNGDMLAVGGNGPFVFAAPVASGVTYAVTIATQPTSPVQSCSVSGGTGTVGGANVASVTVNCSTTTFTVGGTITGLNGTVILQNAGANNLTVTGSGTTSFAFGSSFASGSVYNVTVLTQPQAPRQTCTVTSGVGQVGAANVTSVAISCTTNVYTVAATVQGLLSSATVALQNNGGDTVTATQNGLVTFATSLASGTAYAVTVSTQPSGMNCTVANGGGTVGAANVTNVVVTCVVGAPPPPTGGTITTVGGYRIHTFTAGGTFQVFGATSIEYLIVGGGGGGGSGDGAGGGAGGMLTGSTSLAANSYAVVVGAGGAGAGAGDIGTLSQNGINSSFAGLTSIGGGRGGQEDNTGGGGPANLGGVGGSGGGFGGANAGAGTIFPGAAGTSGQGTNGGTRFIVAYGMGGGGGAGGAGGDGSNGSAGGAGGIGLQSSISGSAVFYAGGGGGAGRAGSGGAGGSGVGGAGGLNANGSPGMANRGGGGGGGGDQNRTGGAGGSGIVIIRYPVAASAAPNPTFLWLDATEPTSITKDASNNVTQWRDLSGLGRHANNVGGTPVWTNAVTPNNQPAILFNGPRMQTAAVPTSSDMTIFVVFNMVAPETWGSILNQAHDTYFSIRKSDCCGGGGNLNFHIENNNAAPLQPIVNNTWRLLTAMRQGTTSTMYYSTGTPTSFTGDTLVGGANVQVTIGNAIGGGQSMGGYISEIRAYTTALNTTDRGAVESELKAKYGL